MKLLRDENGQVLILTAVSMVVLIGFLGLAADVGTLLYSKRQIQSAADSAALAGASEINWATIDNTTVTAAAKAASAQAGFTDGSNGVTVTVNRAPLNGPYTGNSAYVEVIVQKADPTFFMKYFNKTSMTVASRAVAGLGGVNNGCIFALSPNASPAVQLQGKFDVIAPNCGVVVNSNATGALNVNGAAGSLTAQSVGVVGTATGQTGTITPAPVQGIAPITDPLAFVTPPDPTKLTCTSPGTLTGAVTAGCYKGNTTINNATLGAGTYVFYQGNVTLQGTITTAAFNNGVGGVTLDINDGSLTENTGTNFTITAPDSTGQYPSIAIMQPLANTNQILFDKGTSGGTINGIIYAPGAQLYLQDHGGTHNYGGITLNSDLIVNSLDVQAATFAITSYSQGNPGSTLLKDPVIVE